MEKFIKFLNRKRKIRACFAEAAEDEMNLLIELGKGKLPPELIELYHKMMPKTVVEIGDFVMYPIERIKAENFDAVPGANIYPFGFFTFMSTYDGDAICVDLNSGAVYQCSHSLLSDGEKISFYTNKMINLDLNYESIIKCSVKLADSFREFTEKIKSKDAYARNVVQTVINNYRE